MASLFLHLKNKIMLILFDIDGTLLDTGGAGMTSLMEASQELYGGDGPPLDLAGSTDNGVVMGIWDHFEMTHEPTEYERFYDLYVQRLMENLKSERFSAGRVLPGALQLLKQLENEGHVLGLLTGNTATGAKVKTDFFGLSEHFTFGAYGDDHHDRNMLGPIALERAEKVTGYHFSPSETMVIGDTPKDIACARAFGAHVVAVATGKFSREELLEFLPDRILESLVDWNY